MVAQEHGAYRNGREPCSCGVVPHRYRCKQCKKIVVRQPPLRAERPELGKDAEMQGRERHEGSSGVGRGLCSQSSKNTLGTRRSEDWSLGQTLELHGRRDMGEMKPWRLVTWSRAGPS